jgi:glycosyltransferase involved in cell wall biosynthesis
MKTMPNATSISVIIPNYNGGATIGECLRAAFSSNYSDFEVVVVDDASTDDSRDIITKFPCKLMELKEHSGVSKARNIGAENSSGGILLFIDSDCLLEKDALALVESSVRDGLRVIGGTYTPIPFDSQSFFSTFQSIFINYHEAKEEPDYIAAHCLAIERDVFNEVGGFIEDSYMGIAAGVEDVELSHRLRRAGYGLKMNPRILVRHFFDFTFHKSMANAFKKSMVWTMYSLKNKDWFKDSGTASQGLKINVLAYFTSIFLALLYIASSGTALAGIPVLAVINLLVNRGLLAAFYRAKGFFFALKAGAYYFLIYPMAVGLGSFAGLLRYIWEIKLLGRYR